MDLIYYISTVILVSIIHSQTIPCHLPDQEKFIFVEGSVGKICDPKKPGQLKNLPKGNKLSADQCTHILDGKLYRVLQKKVTDRAYIQWRFCGSGNKFDRQICQYNNKCYLEENILAKMKKSDARTGQDCDKLTRKMRNKYREIFKQMFIYSSESCDLNKLIPSPDLNKSEDGTGDGKFCTSSSKCSFDSGSASLLRLLKKSNFFCDINNHHSSDGNHNETVKNNNKSFIVEEILKIETHSFHDAVSIPMKDSRQKKDYPQIKLQINSSNLGRSIPIDKCRHGIYNNIFYVKNEPKYCIINDLSKDKNKCLSMRLLNDAMKYNLSAENFEYYDNGDFTAEYKRYIFKYRYTIYDKGDTYPSTEMLRDTLYKLFNRNYSMTDGFYWGDKYTLFVRQTGLPNQYVMAVVKCDSNFLVDVLLPSMVDVQQTQLSNEIGHEAPKMYPPKLLCDVYLTLFPVSNTKLRNKVPIEKCPDVEQARYCKDNGYPNSKPIRFPNVFGMVNYDSNKKPIGQKTIAMPIGCSIPNNHADFVVRQCISFEEAENLLNHKNNEDEDVDPGKGILYIENVARPEMTVKHYRRNYMAGVLRMHQAGHKPHQYQEPEIYYWSNLRRTNSIQDILLAISAALGYENDEKRDFVINNQWNEPKSVKVSLSVDAFCRAILEMIPFSRQVLRKAKQQSCY